MRFYLVPMWREILPLRMIDKLRLTPVAYQFMKPFEDVFVRTDGVLSIILK